MNNKEQIYRNNYIYKKIYVTKPEIKSDIKPEIKSDIKPDKIYKNRISNIHITNLEYNNKNLTNDTRYNNKSLLH
jgi:hypothetical protein